MARAIIEHSREVWLAADHSKFNRAAMVEVARLDQIDALFTDQAPPGAVRRAARRRRRGTAWSRPMARLEPRSSRRLMNDHLLALDQGTSSSRSHRVPPRRPHRRHARSASSGRSFRSRAGSSTTPNEIWDTQLAVAREALAASKLRPRDIAAIGITNQRETTLLWNRAHRRSRSPTPSSGRTGAPSRCARSCVPHGLAEQVRASTGLVIDPYFSGTKIRWLLDHVPGAHVAAARGELAFGTIDSWLLWKLTGGARARHRRQQRVAHDAVRHPAQRLGPRAAEGAARAATACCRRCCRRAIATPTPTPRCSARRSRSRGIAGDQQSALFGQACFTPGLAKNTYGTGCFMLMHTGGDFRTSTQRAGHHQRGADQHRRAAVRARRQRLRRRRGGAVAARRPGRHQVEQRRAGAGRRACPTPAA